MVEEGRARGRRCPIARHPYTWALLHAAPRIDTEIADRRLVTIEGQPPDPLAWPDGCRFRARCPFAVARCVEHPELLPVGEGRAARCWITQDGARLEAPVRAHEVAAPVAASQPMPLLELRDVKKHFLLPKEGLFAPHRVLHAVDGVDLQVMRGETVGLVGRVRLRQVDPGAPGGAAARAFRRNSDF